MPAAITAAVPPITFHFSYGSTFGGGPYAIQYTIERWVGGEEGTR